MLRLQKFLAQAGLGSRRSSEQLIKDGKIVVNGEVAILGAKVSQADGSPQPSLCGKANRSTRGRTNPIRAKYSAITFGKHRREKSAQCT